MKKILVYALLSSITIMAHELLPRHESPAFAVAVLWLAAFAILFYTYEYISIYKLAAVARVIKAPELYIPALYIAAQHAAMQISQSTEILTAISFLVIYSYYFYTNGFKL